ncbi:hypothetical protein [Saccharopolyspora phatthalungensis]|uniref:Uncharacterized protein n=1 Tax=Saccharopolyspora phatthalungensis TaxID=664693 RepID=A0A840QJR3_9PSEU|nr:hypothetical protein [Saccharopolyspora phatthalungensis]MBB5159578.1 hypothetical protein [Saccharopolyspora phatthalungensis]
MSNVHPDELAHQVHTIIRSAEHEPRQAAVRLNTLITRYGPGVVVPALVEESRTAVTRMRSLIADFRAEPSASC